MSKRTIEILVPYSEDANDAVAGMWGQICLLQAELEKERAVTKALQSVTRVPAVPAAANIPTVTRGFITGCELKQGVKVPGLEDLTVKELMVDGMPEIYWKRLKKELDDFLTAAQGRF